MLHGLVREISLICVIKEVKAYHRKSGWSE